MNDIFCIRTIVYKKMNVYSEEIAKIEEILSNDTDLNALTRITNKSVTLRVEIDLELFNRELPLLREETNSEKLEKMQLQQYREKLTPLLQTIVDKIGEELERIFSEYLTEELRNPYERTIKKVLFEGQVRDLKSLFLSIDNVL